MGFFKKIAKKVGRVVTSKSKTTKKIVKVAAPIAAIAAAPFIIGGTASAIFAARSLGQNSEESTSEPAGESFEDREAAMYAAYGPAQARQGPGFFSSLGSSLSSLFKAPAAKPAAAAAAAGGSATTCADPAIITQAMETVCRLCGGG